jgi:hypothetical protein
MFTAKTQRISDYRRSDFSRELLMFATKVASTDICEPLYPPHLCG